MEQIFDKVEGIAIFLDDINIKGNSIKENLERTTMVLDKLEQCGLKLKKSICKLLERRIEYLVLEIDRKGVHILKDRIEAIEKAPTPTNSKAL